jgi:Cys-tRNA(Pro)/Cys-tRNA(Cys) deacylase
MKNKTNAMRILDSLKIKYTPCEYDPDESDLSGVHIAHQIGLPEEQVFKTLVAKGDKSGPVVFVIPCAMELDLKKCAVVSGNKRVELIAVKELLGLTGYIRGGCSPVGMKKDFPTFIDETAQIFDTITVSAGVRGAVMLLSPTELCEFCKATFCDIVF